MCLQRHLKTNIFGNVSVDGTFILIGKARGLVIDEGQRINSRFVVNSQVPCYLCLSWRGRVVCLSHGAGENDSFTEDLCKFSLCDCQFGELGKKIVCPTGIVG